MGFGRTEPPEQRSSTHAQPNGRFADVTVRCYFQLVDHPGTSLLQDGQIRIMRRSFWASYMRFHSPDFSGVGGGQVVGEAVGPHLRLLMGEDTKFAAGHRAAEKDEAGSLVFGEI